MADFTSEDLTGSVFEDVDLTRARFHNVDLAGADFRLVRLTGARIRDALLVDMDISGRVSNLRVNGVDVAALVEGELNRRYPDRAKMTPADADGFREAWDILERLWQQTVARARGMAPELLHERVDEEWSFIETLRHLVFATDAWVRRAILGDPAPWDPLDLPNDGMYSGRGRSDPMTGSATGPRTSAPREAVLLPWRIADAGQNLRQAGTAAAAEAAART